MDKKQILYDLIKAHLGIPYIWGGDDPSGYDCSGFILELLKSHGIVENGFDATSKGLFTRLKARTGSAVVPAAGFGRIAFYGSDIGTITHVAICLDDRLVAEAGGGDQTVKTADDAARKNAFIRIRPLACRKDLVAILHIDWGF